jgi:hypothetical protein
MESSELIKRQRSRAMFANWTQQKQRQQNGEILHLDIESGSGSTHQVSLLNYILNGAIETTVEEQTRYIQEVTHDNLEDVISKIFVAEAPSNPIIQNYFIGSESITINFNPPEDDGGSPILGYEYSIDEGESYLRNNMTINSIVSNDITTKNLKIYGLTNGTTYKIRLRAYNSIGEGEYSSITETPGSKPSQIILSNNDVIIGNMSLTINFTPPYDGGFPILGYEYTLNGSPPKRNNLILLNNSITITGLSNETIYDITLRAYNIIDSADDSNIVTAQPGILPYAPSITSFSGGNETITINFEPRYNGGRPILGYEYSFYVDGNYEPYLRTNLTIGDGSLTISGLTNGNEYTIKIRAYTILGEGADSNSVTVAPGIVPRAPIITSSSIANQSIIINFDPPYNGGFHILGYEYSFDTDNHETYYRSNLIINDNSLTILNLTNGSEYTIKIRAYNIRGDGLPSESVTRTPGVVPNAPTITSSSSGEQSITITFTTPYNGGYPIEGYEYSFVDDNYQTYFRNNMTTDNGSLTISGLTNGNTYTIKIRAYNTLGGGATSESIIRKAGLVPSPPINLGALPGDQSVRICFTIPNSGSTPITEYQYSLDGASFTKDNATFGEGNITITGLLNNINYSIRLIACNSIGCSEPSTSLEFNLPILNNNGWTIGLGSGSGTKIISDDYGNYYVLANVSAPFVVNSIGTKSGTQLTPSLFGTLQFGGACIIKYNRAGDVQWATVVQGITGISIGTDKCGNVILGGNCNTSTGFVIRSFSGISGGIINTPIFASVPLATPRSSGPHVAIIKYNTSGSALWTTQIGGPANDDLKGLDTDSSGNIYITTTGTAITTFDYIIEVFNANLTNPIEPNLYGRIMRNNNALNTIQIYVIKYDKDGLAKWVAQVGSNTSTYNANSVTVDSLGNIYITATSSDVNPFNISSFDKIENNIIYTKTSLSYVPEIIVSPFGKRIARSFIIKYDINGQAQWAAGLAEASSSNQIENYAVTTDSLNNVYVSGKYPVNPYIYNASRTPYGTFSGTAPGGNDAILIKYNAFGVVQWATRIAGANVDIGYGLATDSTNAVYIIGSFNSALLNVGSFSSVDNTSKVIVMTTFGELESSGYDAFLIKYNSSGVAQWATKISGAGTDQGYGITVDGYDRILITGSYTSNPLEINTFGSNSGGTITLNKYAELENSGGTRVFLVKYKADGLIE